MNMGTCVIKKAEYTMNAHEIYSTHSKTMVVVLEIYFSKFYYNVQYIPKEIVKSGKRRK